MVLKYLRKKVRILVSLYLATVLCGCPVVLQAFPLTDKAWNINVLCIKSKLNSILLSTLMLKKLIKNVSSLVHGLQINLTYLVFFWIHRGGVWFSINLPGLCPVQAGPQVWRGRSELLQSCQGCLHRGDQVCHVSAEGRSQGCIFG